MKFSNTTNTKQLKDLINEIVNSSSFKKKYDNIRIINTWKSFFGSSVEKRTEKIYVKERKLFVKISSPPLKNELSMMKSKILERLNTELSEKLLDEIIFL